MNLSRLMVLGMLAKGPRHGHQIRRDAEITNVGNWGGVSVGALYRELHRMEEEGLVEPLRSEQVGRRPARTIYQITGEGFRELRILWEQAIAELHPTPDPLGVAVLFAGAVEPAEIAGLLRARRQTLAIALERLTADRERLEARGYLSPSSRAVMRRGEMHLGTELAWHAEFDPILSAPQDPSNNRTEPDDILGAASLDKQPD
jgi:DNA-binding PadR family transcriptional regulator